MMNHGLQQVLSPSFFFTDQAPGSVRMTGRDSRSSRRAASKKNCSYQMRGPTSCRVLDRLMRGSKTRVYAECARIAKRDKDGDGIFGTYPLALHLTSTSTSGQNRPAVCRLSVCQLCDFPYGSGTVPSRSSLAPTACPARTVSAHS